jgi:hypothetical protein
MVKDAIRRMAVDERRIEIDMAFLGEAVPGEPRSQAAENQTAENQTAEDGGQ